MKMVIDRAGRMVVPKPLRDQLGLKPGSELDVMVEDGQLVAKPAGGEVALVRNENGRLVFRATGPVPSMTNEDWLRLIHEAREARLDELQDRIFGAVQWPRPD